MAIHAPACLQPEMQRQLSLPCPGNGGKPVQPTGNLPLRRWYLAISVVCALLFSAYLVYDIQVGW